MLCRCIGMVILAGLVGTTARDRPTDSLIVDDSRMMEWLQYGHAAPTPAGKELQASIS